MRERERERERESKNRAKWAQNARKIREIFKKSSVSYCVPCYFIHKTTRNTIPRQRQINNILEKKSPKR
jgi:hypothetical protein